MEATVHKLRKPRLVVYNIPEDISLQNIEDTLLNYYYYYYFFIIIIDVGNLSGQKVKT